VALVGATFVEREQRYGYLETALTSRFPDRHAIFRNFAWSGDTVYGDARGYFDRAEQGFQRLKQQLDRYQPTLVFVGYGWAESWQGEAGLGPFTGGMDRLLDLLEDYPARVVLITPPPHEHTSAPLPDAAKHNADLAIYSERLRAIAAAKNCALLDLFAGMTANPPAGSLTDNGVHFTAAGYWTVAPLATSALGLAPLPDTRRIEWDAASKQLVSPPATPGTEYTVAPDGLTLTRKLAALPAPPAPFSSGRAPTPPLVLYVKGLPDGVYALSIDGAKVASASAQEWSQGVSVSIDPDAAQAERLRQAIVKKNEWFFHRWRPANETYIFGFRKHEQGQNAAEMPQFEPLIADQEKLIDELRAPTTHRLQLTRD
jgi:lysophospholipase L1-like esterase